MMTSDAGSTARAASNCCWAALRCPTLLRKHPYIRSTSGLSGSSCTAAWHSARAPLRSGGSRLSASLVRFKRRMPRFAAAAQCLTGIYCSSAPVTRYELTVQIDRTVCPCSAPAAANCKARSTTCSASSIVAPISTQTAWTSCERCRYMVLHQ